MFFLKDVRGMLKQAAKMKEGLHDTVNDVSPPLGEAIKDVASLVYSSTSSHDKGIRNLKTSLLHHLVGYNIAPSQVFSVITEEPTYAVELATHLLGREDWQCWQCDEYQATLITMYKDGNWDWKEEKCQEEVTAQNQCLKCGLFGTLTTMEMYDLTKTLSTMELHSQPQ